MAMAADARVEREAKALQKKAIEEDNLNVNYAAAIKKLLTAVSRCGGDRCSAPLRASLLRDLGAMELLAGSVEAGKGHFAQALRLDPSLDLDPAYKNPMLEGVWNEVKSKGDGAQRPAAAAPPSSAGDFTHAPPTEGQVRTPLAIYAEYAGSEQIARVIVRYKGAGAHDWKTIDLKKTGDGYGALIPCKDVTLGSISYYLQGFDDQNQPVAMAGSRTAPFAVDIKSEISGAQPSLPGRSPPAQCGGSGEASSTEAECPPGFPGCKEPKKDVGDDCDRDEQCTSGSCAAGKCVERQKKEGGEACASNDDCKSGACSEGKCSAKKGGGEYCENDSECTSGSCDDSKCAAVEGPVFHRFWLGASVQADLYILPGASNVCLLNMMGTKVVNTAGYSCVDPNTNQNFPGSNASANASIRQGELDSVGSGIGFANIRALATFDYALTTNMLLGFRAGYIARTDPALGRPGPAFPPLHLELRFTYLFGSDALTARTISPMVFGAAGLGEFDAFVPIYVVTNGTTQQPENAWLVAGPAFVAAGGGIRWKLGSSLALNVAAKLELGLGGAAGSLIGIAPELGLQYGF
jgi:hypothetical protein